MDHAAAPLPHDLRSALAEAAARGVEARDARLLLSRLVGRTPAYVRAHDETRLDAGDATRWRDWVARRAAGEPVAYLLGEKEFHGHRFAVNGDVLVPRPETEGLVEWALERAAALRAARGDARPLACVDLGTGSGAIAVSVALALGDAVDVTAVDVSAPALAVAARNATDLGARVAFLVSHWWQALAGRRYDLALSNPPYVDGDDPALEALVHEPRGALTPGADGHAALAAIVDGAAAHLVAGGWLLLEHGRDQGAAVRARLEACGFADVETRRDLAGHERLTGGRWPGATGG